MSDREIAINNFQIAVKSLGTTMHDASKALIKLRQAADKIPTIEIPPTKYELFARAVCLYFSTNTIRNK